MNTISESKRKSLLNHHLHHPVQARLAWPARIKPVFSQNFSSPSNKTSATTTKVKIIVTIIPTLQAHGLIKQNDSRKECKP